MFIDKLLRRLIFVFFDLLFVVGALFFAMLLTNGNFSNFVQGYWYVLLIAGILCVLVNSVLKLYSKMYRFVSVGDALFIMLSSAIGLIYFIIVALCVEEISIGCAVVFTLIYTGLSGSSRFAYRVYCYLLARIEHFREKNKGIRVIIIGAGNAGSSLVHEMTTSDKINYIPVCILDDDPLKEGMDISGVKIFGSIDRVEEAARLYQPDEIVIAIPSLAKKELKEIIERCKEPKCKIKNIPGAYQFVTGQISVSDMKEVSVHDLLGREQVETNLDEVMGYIQGKIVMVTGGGGSIGSELCRQIAAHQPKQLIILDIYENNAYEIEQELKRKYKEELNLVTLIASVRDLGKIDNVFDTYSPQIVFHAAAHKHVPLMETSPNEAVKNNVCGTYNVADSAGRHGVERFVLISTDKAVNPTNIMGATQRICEMIIQTINKKYQTEYVAVRFGNVLGSNGSVIPLFTKQILEGGPVTVTHKDIVRYFMTIPEAVSLVLQAGAYAKGGEIFVLDMGEPVRIYDLAINMIKLSGLVPKKDIDVVITGLRPGEKLYEERLMKEEGLQKTANQMISIGKPLDFDEHMLFSNIEELKKQAYDETDEMKKLVKQLVPTYKIDKNN